VRTRSLELSRVFRRAYSVATGAADESDEMTIRPIASGGAGAHARRLVHDFVYLPDAQVGWIPFAARAAADALAAAPPGSVVLSSSGPVSSHFAAMWAARRSGAPWVAEFRDPFASDPGPTRTRSMARQRVNRRLEDRILRAADHVVVTTESTRQEMLRHTPDLQEERISIVRNGFEPVPAAAPPGPREPMTVVYVGTVAPGEETGWVLTAFDLAHADRPDGFRLRVVGPPGPWQDSGPDAGARRPWLQLDGVVSPVEARTAMAAGSALLLIRHPDYRIHLPGKAFDYIGARRPIIAAVPPVSEMEDMIMRHSDARILRWGETESLARVIEQFVDQHRAGELQAPRVPESLTAPLARRDQVARLAEIFDLVSRVRRVRSLR
jgi:hypothetical protein